MGAREPQIIAFGGGGFSMEAGNPLLDEYVLAQTGAARPKVCFLPTASGDADHYIVRFYHRFAEEADASHVSLFRRGVRRDVAAHLRRQDLIYVGGGNVISMLGAWRANGIDEALREAWEAGVLLCGLSAGSLCWFTEALTAFDGDPTIVQGLGLLPHSNCVHYTNEPERRVEYTRFVGDGMAPGYAADDGAALHFRGTALHRVVTSRPGAKAYRVEHDGERVVERELDAAFLGAQVAAAA